MLAVQNYQNTNAVHISRGQLRAHLKDPKKKEEYKQCVEAHEAVFNSLPPNTKFKSAGVELSLPSWITASTSQGLKKSRKLDVFWPESVLKRHAVDYKESDLVECEGEPERGLYRDAIHGAPSGCATFEFESKKEGGTIN